MNKKTRRNNLRWLAGGIGAGALIAGAGMLPGTASAAFTSPFTGKCNGADLAARGASFQRTIQDIWRTRFKIDAAGCPNTTAFFDNTITYDPAGSGAGLTAMGRTGTLDPTVRMGGTDDAPSPAEVVTMESAGGGNQQQLRVTPVGAGSLTMVVNLPDGCTIPTTSPNYLAPPAGVPGATARVRVGRTNLEQAWAGVSTRDTWGELISGIAALPGQPPCGSRPIRRVVRLDSSGTTIIWKQYLNSINAARGWLPPALGNQDWPNNAGTTAVVRGTANGNGPLLDAVRATDGSIGYTDLATARAKNFDEIGPNANDGLFWVPVANAAGGYREPTNDPNSIWNGVKGSKCINVPWVNIPAGSDPTLVADGWNTVQSINPAQPNASAYPGCGLTYVLTWSDSSDAYGISSLEQGRQRTVRDYLGYMLSSQGQAYLLANDYAPLNTVPLAGATTSLLGLARVAWTSTTWNEPGA